MARPGSTLFWQRRRRSMRSQLEAYAEVMRKVQGNDLPLRLALYFPLLTRLVWW